MSGLAFSVAPCDTLFSVGGVPDPWQMTGGRYLSMFVGCIGDIYLNGGVEPLDFTRQAVRIVGVLPCRFY